MAELAQGGIIRGPIVWPGDEGCGYLIPTTKEQRDKALEMLRKLAEERGDG